LIVKTKESKSVGEWFELLPSDEHRKELLRIARIASFAENSVWMEWRCGDPVTGPDMARRQAEKESTGEWPKLEAWNPKTARTGESWCKFAGALCPGLMSYIYDAIANSVATLYRQKRLKLLTFQERLATRNDLQIRFRENACRVLRHPEVNGWFRFQLSLAKGPPMVIDFKCRGKSPHTIDWLNELADSGEAPSGGMISARRKKGRLQWQIALSRVPREGENEQVKPISGRVLWVWAPIDQAEFLRCQVHPVPGRPWLHRIEAHDLIRVRKRFDVERRRMGRNYAQSTESAAHGHGLHRAINRKEFHKGRYDRRCKDWIENRSAEIVRFAIKSRCEELHMEKLSNRDPTRLALGPFPYFQFVLRTVQKARSAGLKTAKFTDFETIEKRLTGGGK